MESENFLRVVNRLNGLMTEVSNQIGSLTNGIPEEKYEEDIERAALIDLYYRIEHALSVYVG